MWPTPHYFLSPFAGFAQGLSVFGAISPQHFAAQHATGANFISFIVKSSLTSTSRRRLLLTARSCTRGLADSSAVTGVLETKTRIAPTTPTRPLVTEALTTVLGKFTPSQLKPVIDSREGGELERLLRDPGSDGERAVSQLRDLLEAVVSVVGKEKNDSAVKVITGCSALLLWESRTLRERVHDLLAKDGVCSEEVSQLIVAFPSFLTLSPGARDTIGHLLGTVGLTAKEVARLAKRRPHVLESSEFRRLVDVFLFDLEISKTGLRKMIRSQPSLLSLSLTGDVQRNLKFFVEEMGLGKDQVAKIVRTHPQVLSLNLDKNIRPVVQWLGSPDPSARIATVLSSTIGAEDPRGPTISAEKPSLQSYYPYSAAAAGSHGEENRQQDGRDGDVILGLAEGRELNEMGLPSGLSAGETPIKVPAYVCGEWEWGLGLGPEERKRVIFKKGDMLWKSVPGNLAKSTAWFVEEVGLSWDAMRKLAARSPALLCLSVENNLRPTLKFLLEELGMDRTTLKQTIVNQPTLLTLSVPGNLRPKVTLFRDELGVLEGDIADLLNQCPRVMNASVRGRILPRFQAMRDAGVSPAFSDLRAICNYTESRFSDWLERHANPIPHGAASSSIDREALPSRTAASKTCDSRGAGDVGSDAEAAGSQSQPHRSVVRDSGEAARPSFRADSLAELGISYAVRSLFPNGERVPSAAAIGASGKTSIPPTRSSLGSAVAGEEAFAPGRTGGRALVRKVSRGLEVLDLFCGTGGFALNSALGGARSALGVDKSARAVRASAQNALANDLADTTSFVKAEALHFARQAASEGRAWDLVVIDPPTLRRKSSARASNAYARMAGAVSRLLRSGGMLMVVDGSSGEIFETHEEMVEMFSLEAARVAGLSLTLLDAGGESHAPSSPDSEHDASEASRRLTKGTSSKRSSVYVSPEAGGVEYEAGRGSEGNVEALSARWALFVCSNAPRSSAGSG